MAKARILFDHLGIGNVLSRNTLRVPPNQREYAWEDKHVLDLYQDLDEALNSNRGTYFLGTIVFARGDNDGLEVCDGQQRLATTTILLAAIRDYFHKSGNELRRDYIEQHFLNDIDPAAQQRVPRLTLNVDDRDFFRRRVIERPDAKAREIVPTRDSHRRLARATDLAASRVDMIIKPVSSSGRDERLLRWVSFLKDDAEVIQLIAPNHLNAFIMFETLNDRGLQTSEVDLLKNFLFGETRDRIGEAQHKWSTVRAIIESVGDDSTLLTYLRHVLICLTGPTKEREIYDKVRARCTGQQAALEFLDLLVSYANDFVALLNTDHEKWNSYSNSVRGHLRTMLHDLQVEQIRPLMLAVARNFTPKEAAKAFKLFVCWSVRFLIAGGRGGLLDRNYSIVAESVAMGEISTAKQLTSKLIDILPTDAAFRASFIEASVSKSNLARYYLRALELQYDEEKEPELVPNHDEEVINLEHVLPQNAGDDWKMDDETARAYYRRLGNLVLMKAKENVAAGNKGFASKKGYYAKSEFHLTREVANKKLWGVNEINQRQKRLGELAVSTWPLRVR